METHPLDSRTGRFPWQVVLIFVAAAAISRAPAVIVLAFGVLVSWVVVAVTGRLALSAVAVRLTLSPDRIVAGEQAIATLEIANRKPVPLPWLEARIFLGEGVEPSRGAGPPPGPPPARGWVDCGFPLRGPGRVAGRPRPPVPPRGAPAPGPGRARPRAWVGFWPIES